MIFKLILVLVCLSTFSGILMEASAPLSYDLIADNLMKQSSKRLEKKHKLHLAGITGGMFGCVKLMGFSYQLSRPMNKDEARAVIIDCVQTFLEDVNKDESIKKYLQVYPFDAEHIEITIYMRTPEEGTLYYPDLSVVTARRGKIMYFTKDPDKEFGYKTEEEEFFEDAVKIVQSQSPPQMIPD